MKRPKITICMATYNGINFIDKQVKSIISQLNDYDEFIISDDGSNDGTWEYLVELEKSDSRIKIYKGPQMGPNANFFWLFTLASSDIIFVSDQDDVWLPNKIDTVCKSFVLHPNAEVVLHKDIIKNNSTNVEVPCVRMKHGVINNLIKNSYSGHRLAFKKDLCKYFLNEKDKCPAYDQYIGLLAEKRNSGYFINDVLDFHLIHGNNVSKPLSIIGKISIRMRLIFCILLSKK